MSGLVGVAAAMLSQSEKRVEIAAENVANLSSPGYKKRVGFSEMIASPTGISSQSSSFVDLSAGKLRQTGNPTDLAIVGDGFFVVSDQQETGYTRAGQFTRTADGRLVNAQGLALQAADGGDLVLQDGAFSISADGIVTQAGAPVGRVAIADFADRGPLGESGGLFRATAADPVDATGAVVRQGSLEASNVSTGEEMVAMMEALRRAEGAQRLVNVYDELMGRILGSVGQS
jgi:flagellar basal-body rod protein FlgF